MSVMERSCIDFYASLKFFYYNFLRYIKFEFFLVILYRRKTKKGRVRNFE